MNHRQRDIIFFDGICNLCHWAVNFIDKRQSREKPVFDFAALDSKRARQWLPVELITQKNTVVVWRVENSSPEKIITKGRAIKYILKHLDANKGCLGFLRLLPPSLLGAMYSVISRYRYQLFGKKTKM